MIATRATVLALAAVLGVSTAALAQTSAPAPGAMGRQTWVPGSHMRHEAREAERTKALHDALNIRPDQEVAFQAFADSMRPERHGDRLEGQSPAGQRPKGMGEGPPDPSGMTTPERVDAMGRMMDEHIQKMRERFQRHAVAVKALYAVLGPEQRRTLDALPGLMGHGMGMGHGPGMDDQPGMRPPHDRP